MREGLNYISSYILYMRTNLTYLHMYSGEPLSFRDAGLNDSTYFLWKLWCACVFASAYSQLFRWICLCVTLHDSCIISQASGWSLVVLPRCILGYGWEGHILKHSDGNTLPWYTTAQPHLHGMPKRNGPYPEHVKLWCYICVVRSV